MRVVSVMIVMSVITAVSAMSVTMLSTAKRAIVSEIGAPHSRVMN